MDDLHSNLDKNYIYIRVELINHNICNINHVNTIIINNITKTVLFFEPLGTLKYNKMDLLAIIDLPEYNFIDNSDIGYNMFNSLQKFDCFCQTYILYVYILIIDNSNVNYRDYSYMFNKIITTKNMGYFLFYLYLEFKSINLDIDMDVIHNYNHWKFPTNSFNKFINTMTLMLSKIKINDNNSNNNLSINIEDITIENISIQNISIEDMDDYIMIDKL